MGDEAYSLLSKQVHICVYLHTSSAVAAEYVGAKSVLNLNRFVLVNTASTETGGLVPLVYRFYRINRFLKGGAVTFAISLVPQLRVIGLGLCTRTADRCALTRSSDIHALAYEVSM